MVPSIIDVWGYDREIERSLGVQSELGSNRNQIAEPRFTISRSKPRYSKPPETTEIA